MANIEKMLFPKCVLGTGQHIGVEYLLYDNHGICLGILPGRIAVGCNYRSCIDVGDAKKGSIMVVMITKLDSLLRIF